MTTTWPSAGVISSARATASATVSTTSIRSWSSPRSIAAVGDHARVERARARRRGSTRAASASSHAERVEHLVRLLLAEQPDDERARRRSANSSSSARSSACAPATLCAPSSSTSGWCPTTSSRPGERHVRRTPPRRRRVEDRLAEERLGRGRARSPRCRPGARRAAGGTGRRSSPSGRDEVERRGRRARAVATATPKSRSAQHDPRRLARRRRSATSSGSVSPSTSVAPGLTIPAFSVAISARVGPRYSTWSTLTLVTTATGAVDDVRRVPGAAEADLDHRDVDRDVGEPVERGRGEDLEVARPVRAGTPRPSATGVSTSARSTRRRSARRSRRCAR